MKTIFLPIALGFAALAPAVHAEEAAKMQRFEHEGRIYSYTVEDADGYRVIHGVEERSGKTFKLRVGEHRVRGTVGSQQVSFSLRDVQPLDKPAATLASR